MQPLRDFSAMLTRRHFFGKSAAAIGTAALATLLAPAHGEDNKKDPASQSAARVGGLAGIPHFAPKAKRVIYLFQSGGPSQIELFDEKPLLKEKHGSELPDSVRMG